MEFRRKKGISADDIEPGYYSFVGNPGTGKSTCASLFASCLHQLGIVRTDKFYECTAKDLIGQYVGETPTKTRELLQKSQNGILFIDEAYSLSYDGSRSLDHNYKKEALEEIIAFMDKPENRKCCCIIFAGYTDEMKKLYDSNPGLRSRIRKEICFQDYSADEIYDIFVLFCQNGEYKVSEDVRAIYVSVFEELKKSKRFSNGRTARMIFEETTMRQKRRIYKSDNIQDGDENLILPEDLLTLEEALKVIGN